MNAHSLSVFDLVRIFPVNTLLLYMYMNGYAGKLDQIFLAAHLNDTHVHNSSMSTYPGMDINTT